MPDRAAGNAQRKKCLQPGELQEDRPTDASFEEVQDWVIWQFPRPKRGWLCGAVHPPAKAYGWLPAAIHPDRERLRIHAHAAAPFATPEAAADWLAGVS